MSVIPNFPQNLTDIHHAWHQPAAHPGFPGRAIQPPQPGSGLEFLTFHRDFVAQFHTWYDPQPFADQAAVSPWSAIPTALKDPALTNWNASLATQEVRILSNNPPFATADALGIFIEGGIHNWIHGATATVFNEPVVGTLHSPQSTYFYKIHGLVQTWWDQWWLGTAPFGPNEDWTHGPYYGSRGTFFADVTGDGRADAIVVNDDTVTVRRSTGSGFLPNEDWTHGPYYGSRGIFFADVTGDGRADAIVVNDDTVTVRRSTGSDFGPDPGANEDWTQGPYYGSRGTFFADVTGDGRADAIVVNDDTVTVRRSTGSGFGPNEDWTHGPYYGSRDTLFADVTGERRADAIVVNDDTVTVRRSK